MKVLEIYTSLGFWALWGGGAGQLLGKQPPRGTGCGERGGSHTSGRAAIPKYYLRAVEI